jgi:hypothetical protein
MVERLGNVLYWAASIVASLLIGFAVWGFNQNFGQGQQDHPFQWMALILGAIIWLFGRACRYVLAGR